MPRAIWSGSISFGLVSIPVRMYSAIDEKDVRFHLLHVKDDSRIGYEKICKDEGVPVPDDEIGKAYEISKGTYVYLTEEDFEAAAKAGYKVIDIEDFVPYEEIDPIGGEKPYALLARAMEDAGLVAIATYVMREKQHLGCLRIREGVLMLEKMYFADEVRPISEIEFESASVGKRELEMASELIDRFRGRFDITKYRDDYRVALLDIVKAKQKGGDVHVEPREVAEARDLIEVLRESVEHARRRTDTRRPAGPAENGSLAKMSKRELEQRAKRAGVRGYSNMTKDELVDAVRSAA